MRYIIELNAKYVKDYASRKRAFDKAKEYANADPENLVRIWHDQVIIWENHPDQD